jgi:glycosyltransferase XagB
LPLAKKEQEYCRVRFGGIPVSLVVESRAAVPPGQRPVAEAQLPAEAEYAFLLGRHVDAATLSQACALARAWGVHPHEVLIAKGWLAEDDYYRALAGTAGLPFKGHVTPEDAVLPDKASPRRCLAHGLLKERAKAGGYLLAPERLRPNAVRALLAQLSPYGFSLATPRAVRDAVYHHFAPALVRGAVETLAARRPTLSARTPMPRWQRWALALSGGALVAAALAAPFETLRTVTLLLAAVFVPVITLRAIAAAALLRDKGSSAPRTPRDADATLPTYTILAPLYGEAQMLPQLLHALTQLDWPAAKLDIKLILEAADTETVAAARALRLPSHVEIVVVPDLAPRTKPKALNYALPLARGEYLVIYDAEDRPAPDQLRRAHAAFRAGPPNLATVQARLNIYNPDASWLTRQFTLEYSALFDGLLPTLDRLRLPIPLGGTSNHFRVAALKWLLAWDPFNVTEDADLGTRLARRGYRCAVIASTTYEEAPVRFGSWLRQRTRWLKGFVQTWLVHMRAPRALWRELGPHGFFAFQVMIGGTILSALVHPWFYVLLAGEILGGDLLALPSSLLTLPFWTIAWLALVTGYGAAMALALLAARRRGLRRLVPQVLLMPLYWLLISTAAYRALWQFATAPFKWEKTEHGQS